MTDTVPDPPNYPPYSWRPDPDNIHVTVSTEVPEEPGWDFGWMQIGKNLGYTAVAFVPGSIWAAALHDVQTQQSAGGAWFMAGTALMATVIRYRQRRNWFRRVLVTTAVIGAALSLPVFTALVDAVTGGGR